MLLSRAGFRVHLVDSAPKASLTTAFGLTEPEGLLYQAMCQRGPLPVVTLADQILQISGAKPCHMSTAFCHQRNRGPIGRTTTIAGQVEVTTFAANGWTHRRSRNPFRSRELRQSACSPSSLAPHVQDGKTNDRGTRNRGERHVPQIIAVVLIAAAVAAGIGAMPGLLENAAYAECEMSAPPAVGAGRSRRRHIQL